MKSLVREADYVDHDRFVRMAHGWKLISRRWVELFSRGDLLNILKVSTPVH